MLTRGEVSDYTQAEALTDEPCENLLSDRGYSCDKFRTKLIEQSTKTVIPGRSNRIESIEYDKELYKERNAIERFFCRTKQYRRLACNQI